MKLGDVALFIKSANAGASFITFDIGFKTPTDFEQALSTGVLSAETVSRLYPIPPGDIQVYAYKPSSVIKITIPRPVISGGLAERDFDGVQQFAPLLDIEIPWDAA
jgi:hypothetical protein